MEDKTMITIIGLLVLCVMECFAMAYGINGKLFLAVLVVVAGAIGVPIGFKLKEKLPL